MTTPSASGDTRWRVAIGGALVLTILLRVAWIGTDPSARLSWSNGIFTDPPVMVHAARNATLFGEWIRDYNRDLWVFPLMNGLTRVAYAMAGVGRIPTLWLSALAGFVAVAAVAWGLARSLGCRAAFLGAAFGAVAYYLVGFSRVPVAENVVGALLAVAAALALGRPLRDQALAGAIGVGAVLFGKYHGVGALPGLVLFAALRPGGGRRAVLAMIGGGTVVFLVWGFTLFLPHRVEILDHVVRQSTGLHGDLPFVSSLQQGIGEFFNTVRRGWMFYRIPVIGTVGGLFLMWTAGNGAARRARLADGSAVWAFWFVTLWLYFGLLPYKAPRYFVMIAPTLVAGAAAGVELLLRRDGFRFRAPSRWDEHLPLALWLFAFFFTAIDATKHWASIFLEVSSNPPARISAATYDGIVRFFGNVDTFGQGLVWAGILSVVGYVLVLWNPEILARLGRPGVTLGSRGLRNLAFGLTGAILLTGLGQWAWWAAHRTHFVEDAKSSLPLMVGPDAVILGPLSPLLTQDSALRCYPYFGPPGERGLLEKYGITHLIMSGQGDRKLLEERFPGLFAETVTVQIWPLQTLFAGTMELRRLPRAYQGVPIHDYEPTPFEQGAVAAQLGHFREALEWFEVHRSQTQEFPELVSLESICWFTLEDYDEAEKRIRRAIELRPGDPLNYRNLSSLHLQQGDRREAVRALRKALRIDPKNEEMRAMLQELIR